ncbi:MAG: phosphoribosylamine--glycine ligase [Shimia sp.]
MNILILGSGGREHALAWAVAQNPKCAALFIAPGNPGTAQVGRNVPLDPMEAEAVLAFCDTEAVDLVIVGPEAPLVAGVADRLREGGVSVFGPSAEAARLEGSKAFTKAICDAARVPTAAYAHFTERAAARAYVEAQGAPIVVKADGLAAGKGVTVAERLEDALAALDALFTEPGAEAVIEEKMKGEEASFFVLCSGLDALPIGTAQDHKRVGEGDTGPNTGGMGAYSPAPVLTEAVAAETMERIVHPTLREMAARGTPFHGVLYVGLMIEDGQPRLVEYNVRFGDPECQVLMMRLGGQALDLIQACAEDRLGDIAVTWAEDHAMTVVVAAEGYPGTPKKGSVIGGLDALSSTSFQTVFHAGTAEREGRIVANGGRVLACTGRGATLSEARDRAYWQVDALDFEDGFCRRDIGWRVLA